VHFTLVSATGNIMPLICFQLDGVDAIAVHIKELILLLGYNILSTGDSDNTDGTSSHDTKA
jgi:hypothetical protein